MFEAEEIRIAVKRKRDLAELAGNLKSKLILPYASVKSTSFPIKSNNV